MAEALLEIGKAEIEMLGVIGILDQRKRAVILSYAALVKKCRGAIA